MENCAYLRKNPGYAPAIQRLNNRGLFNRKPFFIGCFCSSKMAADAGYMRACDWFSFSIVLTSWGGSPHKARP